MLASHQLEPEACRGTGAGAARAGAPRLKANRNNEENVGSIMVKASYLQMLLCVCVCVKLEVDRLAQLSRSSYKEVVLVWFVSGRVKAR
jgi:hypothetical protein